MQLETVLERLRPGGPSQDSDAALWKTLDETGHFGAMVGASSAMRETCAVIARIARSDAPVMITGESGIGKEVVAQTIHELSRRRERAVRGGQLRRGPGEPDRERALRSRERRVHRAPTSAAPGCSSTRTAARCSSTRSPRCPPGLQVKFLRVLETRSSGGSAATRRSGATCASSAARNRDSSRRSRRALREDLYYRLNVFPLQRAAAPRAAARTCPLLAKHFLDLVAESGRAGGGPSRAAALEGCAHPWPGNVRELRNVVQRAYVLSDGGVVDEAIVAGVLAGRSSGVFSSVRPPAPAPQRSPVEPPAAAKGPAAPAAAEPPGQDDSLRVPVRVGDSLEDVERRLLERTLAAVGGNKKKAAEILRVSLKTVYNKIKQYKLEP